VYGLDLWRGEGGWVHMHVHNSYMQEG